MKLRSHRVIIININDMSKVLIQANPVFSRDVLHDKTIYVAELFSDTIQGEGIFTGQVSTFLRVQHCSLNCGYCDSNEVWRFGNPYSIEEICDLFEQNGLIEKFRDGQHLVFTGGSPLKQQLNLIDLVDLFIKRYGFKPYIEIENESVLPPHTKMIEYVDCWNNSPKLSSSGNTLRSRYKSEVIRRLSELDNSWFKFVVTSNEDWVEIERLFLEPELIKRSQIILMPEGSTREELFDTRELTVQIAIREGVRYSDRLHIILWDKKTGV